MAVKANLPPFFYAERRHGEQNTDRFPFPRAENDFAKQSQLPSATYNTRGNSQSSKDIPISFFQVAIGFFYRDANAFFFSPPP